MRQYKLAVSLTIDELVKVGFHKPTVQSPDCTYEVAIHKLKVAAHKVPKSTQINIIYSFVYFVTCCLYKHFGPEKRLGLNPYAQIDSL